MGGFSGIDSALKMREALYAHFKTFIDQERPRYRYGVVQSIDSVNNKCYVVPTGQTTSIPVSIGYIRPSVVGQRVRIGGIGTDKFIEDVIGGNTSAAFHIGLRGNLDTPQQITSGNWNQLLVATVSFGSATAWNATSYGVTIPSDGIYSLEGYVVWPNLATGRRVLRIESYLPNTTFGDPSNTILANDERPPTGYLSCSATNNGIKLTAGTNLRIGVYQTYGSTIPTYISGGTVPRLTVRKISDA